MEILLKKVFLRWEVVLFLAAIGFSQWFWAYHIHEKTMFFSVVISIFGMAIILAFCHLMKWTQRTNQNKK